MRFKILIASFLAVAALFCSCAENEEAKETSGKPEETNIPIEGFINPQYPLMDLMDEDLTKYVTLKDVSSLKIEHNVYVEDEVLDEKLSELAKKKGYYVADVLRDTKAGDTLDISFVGKINGVEFEGGSSERYFLTLSEADETIPGVAHSLCGIIPGTQVSVNVTLPDSCSEEIAGKDAVFEIKLKAIVEKFCFTDETVSEYTAGTQTSYEAFRENYREGLIRDNLKTYSADIKTIAIEALEKAAEIKLFPQEQIDCYYQVLLNDHKKYYESYKAQFEEDYKIFSFEDYRKAYKITDEFLVDTAKTMVIEDLIMVSAAKSLGLDFTKEQYDSMIREYAVNEWGEKHADTMINYYGTRYLKLCVIKEQCVDAFLESAEVDTDYEEYKHLLENDS